MVLRTKPRSRSQGPIRGPWSKKVYSFFYCLFIAIRHVSLADCKSPQPASAYRYRHTGIDLSCPMRIEHMLRHVIWGLGIGRALYVQHKLQTYLGSPVPKKDQQFFDWPGELRVEIKGSRCLWAISKRTPVPLARHTATFTNNPESHGNVP